MANLFERFRLAGLEQDKTVLKTEVIDDTGYQIAIKKQEESIMKSMSSGKVGEKKEIAYSQPILGDLSVNPGFKVKPSIRNNQDLHAILKKFGSNIILNAIINTRYNQVSMYCKPARYSEKGLGYQVRLKDIDAEPSSHDEATIKRIESFLENTGINQDVTRDTFTKFCKKVVRDTYMYDQVNFEKIFDRNGDLVKFNIVDPTTIFFATNDKGQIPKNGDRFVQVLDNKIVATFNSSEMAFAVRNPRSDIKVAGYGLSELEIALKQFIAQENTETFNDRFFSHGGTTRGILQIKAGQQQSQHALDIFRREWKNSLSGINGSWQIPVVAAEDVKFVNMTPSARDMEFEKWLNYLINVISSLYGIDPAEINFPNNGGATGSKGGSLNEGNSQQKTQASQNKGLQPLLRFIEDTVNTFILSEFGDKYTFQFIGGDTTTELEKIKILGEKAKIAMTTNEVRKELGLQGDVLGGDVPLNGVIVQRIGQLMQDEQFKYDKQQDRLNRLLEQSGGGEEEQNLGNNFQDKQAGLAGNSDKVNGKGTFNKGAGKDGQVKGKKNANAGKQGMKGDKPNDWQK